MAEFNDFEKLDIRVGEIIEAGKLEEGKYTTHKLKINFGDEIGIKKSCARVINYPLTKLKGKQVLAIVNLSPRQIGKNTSEVLTLGVPDEKNECILIKPDKDVPLGAKLY
jgi:tRNA-binding protein